MKIIKINGVYFSLDATTFPETQVATRLWMDGYISERYEKNAEGILFILELSIKVC